MKYDFSTIEKKWQEIWDEMQVFEAKMDASKPKFFALIEFPYPSGVGLHTGNMRPYTALDVITRKKRLEGYSVLYPIGWDAFGMPTERYAIKKSIHPCIVTEKNIVRFKSQLKSLGLSFDWSREINTSDPNYYKWTQWIFLQMFHHGLAYKKEINVYWCVSCEVALADEEVVGGACLHCAGKAVYRKKSQWMLGITKYAQRLIDDLDTVDYAEYVKAQHIDWISRSELRDWVFSRQRYWGEPIPIVNCDKCGYVPLDERHLPLMLPDVASYKPMDDGKSPLASLEEWVNTTCPKCGIPAKRETDTMPQWAGSSWYFLRYCDPNCNTAIAAKEVLQYWMPVDWYNGGMENTTRHLLYSRFWHKFLCDIGVVKTSEPYSKRTSHGVILCENGEKMSKSRDNAISPDDIVNKYGADTMRLYEMFIGDFTKAVLWNQESINKCYQFLDCVFGLQSILIPNDNYSPSLESAFHKTIQKVTHDIEALKFNTAIATLMSLLSDITIHQQLTHAEMKTFLILLNPFAPHISEEVWQIQNFGGMITEQCWPVFDINKCK